MLTGSPPMGVVLGLLSLAIVAISIGVWLRRSNAVALEGRRAGPFASCGLGVALGMIALFGEPGWIGGIPAVLGIALGSTWIGLGVLASQSRQNPNLALGEPLPAIVAPDHSGTPFDVDSLRGHPVLIKLFRGHW